MPVYETRVKTRSPGIPVILLRLPPYLADEALPAPVSERQREHLLRMAEILAETAAGELPGIPVPKRCAPPVLSLHVTLSDTENVAVPGKRKRSRLRLLTAEAVLASRKKPLARRTVREYWTEDGEFCVGIAEGNG